MRGDLRVGRLFGIDIYIDWSWLVIFVLIASDLALSLFARLHPQWSLVLDWGLAIAAALLFFASVLLHELAHSVVARARGLPIKRIVLYLLGGVSNIEREPPSAATEFVMALVGPLTSVVLGIIFLFLGRTHLGKLAQAMPTPLAGLAQVDALGTLLLWLGSANILIGIFNLIPAFPLDGGRVLRSLLWAFSNNLRRATLWSTWISHAIAWLFILGGIAMALGASIPFFGAGLFNGLWLAFIGWFLNGAATQTHQQVVIEDVLEGIPVSRLMRTDVATVEPGMTVSDLVHQRVMTSEGNERSFPVVKDGKLIGWVSLEDVKRVSREQWETKTVGDIMTPGEQVVTLNPREDVSEVFQKFMQRDVRQMPVMQDGSMVGVLRRQDLMRYLQLHSELGLRDARQTDGNGRG